MIISAARRTSSPGSTMRPKRVRKVCCSVSRSRSFEQLHQLFDHPHRSRTIGLVLGLSLEQDQGEEELIRQLFASRQHPRGQRRDRHPLRLLGSHRRGRRGRFGRCRRQLFRRALRQLGRSILTIEVEGQRAELLGETRKQQKELLLGREVTHQLGVLADLDAFCLLQHDARLGLLFEMDRARLDLPRGQAPLHVAGLRAAHRNRLHLGVGLDPDRAVHRLDLTIVTRVLDHQVARGAHRELAVHVDLDLGAARNDHRRRGFVSVHRDVSDRAREPGVLTLRHGAR